MVYSLNSFTMVRTEPVQQQIGSDYGKPVPGSKIDPKRKPLTSIREKLCFHCGEAGHLLARCKIKREALAKNHQDANQKGKPRNQVKDQVPPAIKIVGKAKKQHNAVDQKKKLGNRVKD